MKYTNKTIVIAIIVAIFLAAAGFFGGMTFQKSQIMKPGRNFGAGGGIGASESMPSNITRRSGGLQGGFTSGDIIGKDNNSVTLKMRDGSTRIIFYSGSTQVSKQTSGTIDDLAVGSSIMVTGSANSDGSISAQSISLRPTNPGANPAAGSAPIPGGQPAAPVQK
jgi:hypothetical protein